MQGIHSQRYTSIRLKTDVKEKLDLLGKKNQSYSDLLEELVSKARRS